MGKRFSDLNDVYDTLVAIKFDFGTLPANNKYRKYYEWKTDPEKKQLPEGSAQVQGPRVRIGLQPFGRAFDSEKTIVYLSNRANLQKSSLPSDVQNALGHVTDLNGFKTNFSFKPARAVFSVKLSLTFHGFSESTIK